MHHGHQRVQFHFTLGDGTDLGTVDASCSDTSTWTGTVNWSPSTPGSTTVTVYAIEPNLGGSGSTLHLAAELFNSMAGAKTVHVPYKVLATGLTDLIGGQIDMAFFDLGTVFQHIRAGRLKVLAIGTEKRHPLLPATPAFSEVLTALASSSFNLIKL